MIGTLTLNINTNVLKSFPGSGILGYRKYGMTVSTCFPYVLFSAYLGPRSRAEQESDAGKTDGVRRVSLLLPRVYWVFR